MRKSIDELSYRITQGHGEHVKRMQAIEEKKASAGLELAEATAADAKDLQKHLRQVRALELREKTASAAKAEVELATWERIKKNIDEAENATKLPSMGGAN